MKNTLALVLALAVVSSPAYASRARLEALGEGKNGSYYINDSRNMFLNPASITKHKKKLLLELGNGAVVGANDRAGDNLAQGGFINTFGDFTYALYLNNTSDSALTAAATAAAPAPGSAIEFQVAGEGALNWGLGVLTGNTSNGADSSSYFGVRAGVEKDALAVFTSVGVSSKFVNDGVAPGSINQIKGKLRLDVGATYKVMNEMTAFGRFSTSTNEATVEAGATDVTAEVKSTNYGAGLGWDKEMTKSTHMFTRVEAAYAQTKQGDAVTAESFNVPVVLGAEAQALSWLAIRGSIGHSLIGRDITGRQSLGNLTTLAAGVGMTFGDVTVDGLVASSGSNGNVTGLGMGTGPAANQNFGFGDGMISRIAMTYNF